MSVSGQIYSVPTPTYIESGSLVTATTERTDARYWITHDHNVLVQFEDHHPLSVHGCKVYSLNTFDWLLRFLSSEPLRRVAQ